MPASTPLFNKNKGKPRNVQLRPVAFEKLNDLQQELSKKYGRHIAYTEIIEAALNLVDRLESMESEDDIAAFRQGQ